MAGRNYGTISNCDVTIEAGSKISASDSIKDAFVYAGAVAGENGNSISGCTVTIKSGGSISASANQSGGQARAGGVVGDNGFGFTIENCTVDIESGGSISANGTSNAYAGGVVGHNGISGIVNGSCNLNGGKIEAKVGESPAVVYTKGTDQQGSASAGTKIGYDKGSNVPVA